MQLFGTAGLAEEPRRVTLARLSAEAARSLAGLGRVAVEGEVVRPRGTGSGAVWLTLRDRTCQVDVRCPARRGGPRRGSERWEPAHGTRVRVTGRIVYSGDRGRLHLAADEVVPVGEGAIEAMIVETRRRLAADGLIDRPRRRIPLLPKVIGVVCGADAAVRADIGSVVASLAPGYPVTYLEVPLSGPGASSSLLWAIEELERDRDVEVIIVTRGGGDPASMLAFSDEELCRKVASCSVPVVTAIGHERDRPLCDEVADLRCATASLAAAAVVPDMERLGAGLDATLSAACGALSARITAAQSLLAQAEPAGALAQRAERASERLFRAASALGLVHPANRLPALSARLSSIAFHEPAAARLSRAGHELAGLHRAVEALSPWGVLGRGFAVVRRGDGTVVRRASGVRQGEELTVQLSQGYLAAVAGGVVDAGASRRRSGARIAR
ncbi:MAG: exodeoxyribonuclease VII large subunit [Acidimicrobiales bacterium]